MTKTPMPTDGDDPLMGRGARRTTVRILTRSVGDTIRLRYISISDSIDSDLSFAADSTASGAKG